MVLQPHPLLRRALASLSCSARNALMLRAKVCGAPSDSVPADRPAALRASLTPITARQQESPRIGTIPALGFDHRIEDLTESLEQPHQPLRGQRLHARAGMN